MKVKIKIERIDPLREGTSKNGYAYANRTVAVSHTENVGENSTYKHTFTCDLHGDFARQFEEKVTVGMEVEADLRFYVETYNFREYQRVKIDTVDLSV